MHATAKLATLYAPSHFINGLQHAGHVINSIDVLLPLLSIKTERENKKQDISDCIGCSKKYPVVTLQNSVVTVQLARLRLKTKTIGISRH